MISYAPYHSRFNLIEKAWGYINKLMAGHIFAKDLLKFLEKNSMEKATKMQLKQWYR